MVAELPPLHGEENGHDPPLKAPVIRSVGVVGVRYSNGVLDLCVRLDLIGRRSGIYVCGSDDLLGKRRENLVPLRCVESSNACGVVEGGLELGHGGAWAHKGGHEALRGGGRLAEGGGTHEGCHCCGGVVQVREGQTNVQPVDVRR